ncbi:proline iminopeptidase [Lentinula raphanica]|nr:proline iminopeptidase [Lentinula raphanica]
MAASIESSYTDGYIPYIVNGESLQTYYKLFGSLDGSKRPLIALHGGPGMSHDYMLPLSDLSHGSFSRPVLFYDQIGSARSSHLQNKSKEFFTIDLFINELVNILSHFKIDEYDLIGHSWGGMLAAEFEIRLHPSGLKSMILTNSLSATKLWGMSTMQLVSVLGEDVQAGMAAGFSDPVKYRAALEKFHAVNGCTISPVPKEITFSVLDQIFGDKESGKGGDVTVPINMFGGALNGWSIEDRLHAVTVPTFVINGRKDIAQDFVCKAFFWKIKQSKWVTFENSSHVPMWEERERYMKLVDEWLENVK